MKKFLAVILAVILSGITVFDIVTPDPLPFIDEGILGFLLVNCLSYIGIPLGKFGRFAFIKPQKKKDLSPPPKAPIDV